MVDKITKRFGPDVVFFDSETTTAKRHQLRATVIVAFSCRTKAFHSYDLIEGEGVMGLFAELLDSASKIVVHNKYFDINSVLGAYFSEERVKEWDEKVLDLFEVIRTSEGSWIGINSLCTIAGLSQKTADGAGAILMWNEGEFKKLRDYCAVDVLMLLELFAQDKVYFCCKRKDFNQDAHIVIGTGCIDMDSMQVSYTHDSTVYPPGFNKHTLPACV